MRTEVNTGSAEIAVCKLHRAALEPSEDVKLLFLLSGMEALYNSKEDRIAVSKIVSFYDMELAKNVDKILWQSYGRRNQIVHGKPTNIFHIKKLVPRLEKILRLLIFHQMNPNSLSNLHDIRIRLDKEAM